MNEDDVETRAPRKGDVLFSGGLPDWQNNACLNQGWGDSQIAYTEGYRRGAQFLIDHVVRTARDQDFLVYPIIFLYRHHIELALKTLLLRTPFLLDRALSEAEKKHLRLHRLDLLWKDLKPKLSTICMASGITLPAEDIEGIDHYISQLAEMDADSFAFRYARTNAGDSSLPFEAMNINLRHFGEVMSRLADYLNGLDEISAQLVDFKAEAEAEWRNEMAQYMDYA